MSRRASAVPLGVGALLAAALGAGAFALLATLNGPTPGEELAARMIGRLDAMHEAQTFLTLQGYRSIPTFCTVSSGRDEIQIGRSLRLQIERAHVSRLSGPQPRPSQLAALAALSACPRFLANGLSARLFADRTTLVRTMRVRGRPVDVFVVSNYAHWPVVQLVVARKNLVPIAIRFRSRRFNGHGEIVGMSRNRHTFASRAFMESIS
jgi:hypothetical protein